MKKQITITEKQTRVVEVEVPSYYNFHGRYSAITEHAVINVWSDRMISYELASDIERYNNAIDNVLLYSSVVICTQQEFETAFNNTIKCLTEQYQLSMSMVLDPKEQTAEGQTTQDAVTETATTEQTTEQATETGEQVSE